MKHDELDRILSAEPQITPSSGFVDSVMDAVRREASAPPPIPFPWKRALPGLCTSAIVLALVLLAGSRMFSEEISVQTAPAKLLSKFTPVLGVWKAIGASWIVLALTLTFVSVKLSMRLMSRKVR